MQRSTRLSSRSIRALLFGGALLIPAAASVADTVYIRSGTDVGGFAMKNVTVTKIAKDGDVESLYYTTDSGNSRSKPLDQVVKIEVDGEGQFNQAEVEFAKGDLKSAGDDYRKAMATTSRDWIKHRADVRLVGISAQTGDFLGAVTGFVEMARKDPAGAMSHKPPVSSAKPAQIDPAILAVNHGRTGAKPEALQVLLPYLTELYNKKGDSVNANATLNELKKLGAAPTVAGATDSGATEVGLAANAAAQQAEADVALTAANTAFAGKQYPQAIAAINSHATAFGDPERQAKALYLLAESKYAMATTPDALSDAALAYMRLVANFKSQQTAPIADALYKTGTIEEKLQKPAEALLIYKQVVNEFKDSKAAQDAQAAIARIQR